MRTEPPPRLLMAVGQRPFDLSSGTFCKALPLFGMNGDKMDASDFPNDGEIWWMLLPYTASLALPGRLIVGDIETAGGFKSDDPHNSQYQIKKDSLRNQSIHDGVEILEVPPNVLPEMSDISLSRMDFSFDHPPATFVLLRVSGYVYGPFQSVDKREGDSRDGIVKLEAYDRNFTVKKVNDNDFKKICGNHILEFQAQIGFDETHRHLQRLKSFSYEYLTGPGYQLFKECPGETIDMEPFEQKLLKFSKDILTRKKRQELMALLKELPPLAEKSQDIGSLLKLISSARGYHARYEEMLNRISDALIQSGMLDEDRIEEAKKRYVSEYINTRTAELQGQIERQIQRCQTELEGLNQELKDRRIKETALIDKELNNAREKAYAEIDAKRRQIDEQQKHLEEERDVLHRNMEESAKLLAQSGDKVVVNFMAMLPLLQRSGVLGSSQRIQPEGSTEGENRKTDERFSLPAYVTSQHPPQKDISEDVFFGRFCDVVEKSGYKYAPMDLARYHLSVKCSELTILGGSSGVGKTSLALLYARALSGGDRENGRRDSLVISVNPSWMEVRDLIGHMNTIDERFCPSETGLYEYLICAQEEYSCRNENSPIYPVCLDEMNLAQVEHYFSDFLQLVEMPLEARTLSCFNSAISGKRCPYRNWAQLRLPPTLRFVGTVNFDETTRRLSDRLLDRANLVTISARQLPSTFSSSNAMADCDGPRITYRHYRSWLRDTALPAGLAKLLDDCRKPLEEMGVPLSARVYRGICRFVASSTPVLPQEKAFDVQVSQRILSRIRNLVTPAQHDALDKLGEILRQSNVCGFDESLAFLEEIRKREQMADWQAGG